MTSGRRVVFGGSGLAVEGALVLEILELDHKLEVEVAARGEASSLVALPLRKASKGFSSAS